MKNKPIDPEQISTWTEILEYSPIKFDRVYHHAMGFDKNVAIFINFKNLDYSKQRVLKSRNSLDLMITVLIQAINDNKAISKKEDLILFAWLKDDLGRFFQALDGMEKSNMEAYNSKMNEVMGVSKLLVYYKTLKNAHESFFEAILGAVKEYLAFEETAELKRNSRTFIYILFQKIQITLSILGGITRDPSGGVGKRGVVGNIPYTALISPSGQDAIRKQYKEDGFEYDSIPDIFKEGSEDQSIVISGEME